MNIKTSIQLCRSQLGVKFYCRWTKSLASHRLDYDIYSVYQDDLYLSLQSFAYFLQTAFLYNDEVIVDCYTSLFVDNLRIDYVELKSSLDFTSLSLTLFREVLSIGKLLHLR